MTHKLLLADDSVTIQRVIELTFADEDIEVITVGDGQLAIDRLDSDPPDIVLADVDMPKRDGYEVAAYIKSRPTLAHIPVVLLTGAFEPIDQARAMQAGSSDVLAKPFEPQMVINRVKQLLGKKREDEEPPRPPALPMRPLAAPRPPARSSAPINDEHAMDQNQPMRPTSGQPAQPSASLDDYFDQLDAAFSNLQPGPPAGAADTMRAESDWIDTEPEPEPPLRQLPPPGRMASNPAAQPPRSVAGQPPRPEQLITPPAGPPPVNPAWGPGNAGGTVPPSSAPRPSIQPAASRLAPPSVVAKPAALPPPMAPNAATAPSRVAPNPFADAPPMKAEPAVPPAPAPPVVGDAMIEEIITRVLGRLSDRVVRDTVSEIVSKTAERLVQDEIQRIKDEAK